MTQKLICDDCGEAIDESVPYYMVSGTKVHMSTDDQGQPLGLVTDEAATQLHYHEAHLPMYSIEGTPIAPPEEPPAVPLALTGLEPAMVVQGSGAASVDAIGSGFTDTAVVVFDGVELATAHRDATRLSVTVDASPGGHAPGTFDVLVRQDGTDTAPLSFTIDPA